jgi:hypothetical protein
MLPFPNQGQNFLTWDYPNYKYEINVKSQHAIYKHFPHMYTGMGVYNINAILPVNHVFAATVNIPLMFRYELESTGGSSLGNIELGVRLWNNRHRDQASVFYLGMAIPFTTLQPDNWVDINGDFNTLPELASVADVSHINWYYPGVWTSTFAFAYHQQFKRFYYTFSFNPGVMLRMFGDDNVSTPSFFFHTRFKGNYSIGSFNIIGELISSLYFQPRNENTPDFQGTTFFSSVLGTTYTIREFQPGIFCQFNLDKYSNQYAATIFGVQIHFLLNKKEKYLGKRDKK